jgi:hypothetical protein
MKYYVCKGLKACSRKDGSTARCAARRASVWRSTSFTGRFSRPAGSATSDDLTCRQTPKAACMVRDSTSSQSASDAPSRGHVGHSGGPRYIPSVNLHTKHTEGCLDEDSTAHG